MKVLAWFVVIFAIVSYTAALKDDICGLPHAADGTPDGRHCLALFRPWTYKQESNECEMFIYGGCGGNDNRFNSKEECEEKCKE